MKRVLVLAMLISGCSRAEAIAHEPPASTDAGIALDSGIEMTPPIVPPHEPEPPPRTSECLDHLAKHMTVPTSMASDQDYLHAIAGACKADEPALAEAARKASLTANWMERARILHRAALADSRFDKRCELSEKNALRTMQSMLDDGTVKDIPAGPTGRTTCRLWIGLPDWCAMNGGTFEYMSVFLTVADNREAELTERVVLVQFARHIWASGSRPGEECQRRFR